MLVGFFAAVTEFTETLGVKLVAGGACLDKSNNPDPAPATFAEELAARDC